MKLECSSFTSLFLRTKSSVNLQPFSQWNRRESDAQSCLLDKQALGQGRVKGDACPGISQAQWYHMINVSSLLVTWRNWCFFFRFSCESSFYTTAVSLIPAKHTGRISQPWRMSSQSLCVPSSVLRKVISVWLPGSRWNWWTWVPSTPACWAQVPDIPLLPFPCYIIISQLHITH